MENIQSLLSWKITSIPVNGHLTKLIGRERVGAYRDYLGKGKWVVDEQCKKKEQAPVSHHLLFYTDENLLKTLAAMEYHRQDT